MSNRIWIKDARIENQQLLLLAKDNTGFEGMKPTGQMLVDSDQLAFIYIVEKDDRYHYLTIPEVIWETIRQGLETNLEITLVLEDGKLELIGFKDEMNYLIENIQGNSNYGEEMVAKVETIFCEPSA